MIRRYVNVCCTCWKRTREKIGWTGTMLRRTPQLEKNGENVTSSVTRSAVAKKSYVIFGKNFDINDKPHV